MVRANYNVTVPKSYISGRLRLPSPSVVPRWLCHATSQNYITEVTVRRWLRSIKKKGRNNAAGYETNSAWCNKSQNIRDVEATVHY